jgi:hypothetical protein
MATEPKGKKISDADNVEGVVTKFKKHTAVHAEKPGGVCFAMTVQWIRGILEKQTVKYTGDQTLATALHGFYTIRGRGTDGFWESRKRLFESQNLKMQDGTDQYFFGKCSDAFDWIRPRPLTVFSIKVPGHALAAYYQKPKAYYFDPNWGVYEYPTISDFCVNAYIHCKFEYCTWDKDPAPNEVFVVPVVT